MTRGWRPARGKRLVPDKGDQGEGVVATACGKTDHKLDDEPRSFVVHLRLTGNSRPNEFATPSRLPVNVPARSSKTASAALTA